MNLQTEIDEVRVRVGEPHRTDESDSFILDREIINWIHQAELQLIQDLPLDALLDVQAEASITTVTLTDSYDLPADFVRLIDVRLDTGQGLFRARKVEPNEIAMVDLSPAWTVTGNTPVFALVGNQILVRPIPVTPAVGANKLKIRYLQEPTRRFKAYRGYTTAAGLITTLVDSSAPGPDDWWKDAEVRLMSNELEGEERTVTAFADSTGTFTSLAWSKIPGNGVLYHAGQVSDLPGEFWETWVAYAAYRALSKDRETDLAKIQLDEYHQFLQLINARFLRVHKSETAREDT